MRMCGFGDFSKQRNGDGGREKDLYTDRPLNCIDTSASSNIFKLFWAHLIHIFDASSSDFSLNFDLKITIYDYRYQFRAFGSRFEHFKVQKKLQGGHLPL
jgi:hypothetical protein